MARAGNNGTDEDLSSLADRARSGLVRELWDLLRYNKKWWLAPIILVMLLVGGFIFLGSTAMAPILYTLF